MHFSFSLIGLVVLSTLASAATKEKLPTIDLGYSVYQATFYNKTIDSYVWKNIRYAAPPVGKLRFQPPQPPRRNRTAIQTGLVGQSCYQAAPLWTLTQRFGLVQANFFAQALASLGGEDCLYLDVYVPRKVFESKSKKKASVLVWIFGGGYVTGTKDQSPGDGLVEEGNDNVIFVAMNYRLGAFGWMSSPSYLASGGKANLGLLDQRAALEWIQKNIHLFGGDKKKVTAMGKSSGGGSIMHQITAYGGAKGNGTVPFSRAIPQSPGWVPTNNKYTQEENYVKVLQTAGCVSNKITAATGDPSVDNGLECLKNLTSVEMQEVNRKMVGNSTYGAFTFGPRVDGTFVPDLPANLLAIGAFDHNVTLMIGHNSDEGSNFVPSNINGTSDIITYFTNTAPNTPKAISSYLLDTLYPPPNETTLYDTQFERASLLVSEGVFTCNTVYMARAFQNRTYNYYFSIPPGTHGQDVPYVFYQPGENATAAGVQNITVATLMQQYITNFAISGDPNKGAHLQLPKFPQYSSKSLVMNFNVTGFYPLTDRVDSKRCKWWSKSLYV